MSTPAGRWDGFLQGGGLKESVFNNLVYQALGVCVRGARKVIASLPAGGGVPRRRSFG